MIGRFLLRASMVLAVLTVAGCGGGSAPPPAAPLPTAAAPPPTASLAESTYKLGSGDRVRIVVFRHEDLSGEFALDGAGNFAMPLIGGTGSWAGPLIGAVLLASLQQAATVTISSAANLMIVGVVLVVFVCAAPHGIIGLFRRRA